MGRRLQYTAENDGALGLPYWALPHCAQQTLRTAHWRE